MVDGTPRLLAVDDDADLCANVCDILEDRGFQVDSVLDAAEALSRLSSNQYDLALLDLRLPGMDGIELCRQIKQLQPQIIPIIITGYASPDVVDQAMDAGAWKVLDKPVDVDALLPMIDRALGRADCKNENNSQ